MTAPRWDDPGPTPIASHSIPPGRLSVDPERIDSVVTQLAAVIDELWGLERELGLYRVGSPAEDPVSVNAAAQATTMVVRSQRYLAEWRRQLVLAKDALVAQRAGYNAADSAARA